MKIILNILILLSVFNCNSQLDSVKISKENSPSKSISIHRDSVQKKYKNKIKKYGFLFVIPPSFKLVSEDLKAIDISKNVKSIETDWSDPENQIDIHLIFHPETAGQTLYEYYLKEKKGIKKRSISNYDALEISEILHKNGKGKKIKPRKKIQIFIKKKDGVLEIIYDFPLHNTKAMDIWKNFLNNIKSL